MLMSYKMRKFVLCQFFIIYLVTSVWSEIEVPNAKNCKIEPEDGFIGKDYKCLEPNNMLDEAVAQSHKELIVCKCPPGTTCLESGSMGNTPQYYCKASPTNYRNSGLNLDGDMEVTNVTGTG